MPQLEGSNAPVFHLNRNPNVGITLLHHASRVKSPLSVANMMLLRVTLATLLVHSAKAVYFDYMR